MKKTILLAVCSLVCASSTAFADVYGDFKGLWKGTLIKTADTCGFPDTQYKVTHRVRVSNFFATNIETEEGFVLVKPGAITNGTVYAVNGYYVSNAKWDIGAKYTNVTKNKANLEFQTFITQNGRRCGVIFKGVVKK